MGNGSIHHRLCTYKLGRHTMNCDTPDIASAGGDEVHSVLWHVEVVVTVPIPLGLFFTLVGSLAFLHDLHTIEQASSILHLHATK